MNLPLTQSTMDLVTMVLGKEVAKRIGDETQLRLLRHANVSELTQTYGLSDRAALKTIAILEIGRRVESVQFRRGSTIRSSADVYAYAKRTGVGDLMVEQFRILLLDAKNRLMEEVLVSQGTLTASLVHPREVFRPAIMARAASMLLMHNHPSGDTSPSIEDVEITNRLCSVAGLVGIEILDHIIVGGGQFASMNELGLLRASCFPD